MRSQSLLVIIGGLLSRPLATTIVYYNARLISSGRMHKYKVRVMCMMYIARLIQMRYTQHGGGAMATDAERRAIAKYQREKTSELRVRVRNEEKAQIDAYADSIGKSTRAYVLDLVKEDMEKAGHPLGNRPKEGE